MLLLLQKKHRVLQQQQQQQYDLPLRSVVANRYIGFCNNSNTCRCSLSRFLSVFVAYYAHFAKKFVSLSVNVYVPEQKLSI